MNKIVLIDGNNILFRSYYATAYSGSLMKNSKGEPTNALYGLINMLNKIITEENPTHIMIAFDKGKTFRHDKYLTYKAGRSEMPDELKKQFLVSYDLVVSMGIKYLMVDNYEADDIIGTYARMVDESQDFEGLIVSSDKDLLQLISDKIKVKLLKANDYIMMDKDKFKEFYGLTDPKRIVDLKSLMGDSSDNIPGVKGIGEKTALSLLQKYDTLDGVYNNIASISGKTKEKLVLDKENAYMSYDIATIYKYVPVNYSLTDLVYEGPNKNELIKQLNDLEFYSFLKKIDIDKQESKELDYQVINNLIDLKLDSPYSIYLEVLGYNYHDATPLGVSIKTKDNLYYVPFDLLKNTSIFMDNRKKYTYDLKKLLVVFHKYDIKIDKNIDDLMLISYLLNKNMRGDIAYLANSYQYDIKFYDKLYGSELTIKYPKDNLYIEEIVKKALFIYQEYENFYQELLNDNMEHLYLEIEKPLSYVLTKMEENGFLVDVNYLEEFGHALDRNIDKIENKIYEIAGIKFNLSSPKQLADILFNKLCIPYPKKVRDSNYSTSKEILDKIKDEYEIAGLILEYRALFKMKTSYVNGIINEFKSDHKIHTIFNQTLTRTGRLSSERPNLQNIPIRDELGKLIRKAFIPSTDNEKIASFDYSQIELRVFAAMSGATNMIEAFKHNLDIHAKTASEIFHVPIDEVTKDQRRKAKAVNFGIIYGISSFGLSEDLGINVGEAKAFIEEYLDAFPGIKNYMNTLIHDAYKNGYVLTLTGRKRIIDEITNKNYIIRQAGERIALNTPVQGTAADILKIAMIKIDEEMTSRNLKSKMLVQVHDELVFEVDNSEIEIMHELVERIMTTCYNLDVPLEVDYEIGNNWYDAK